MANINFAAIRKRIREVVDDGLGSIRVVSASRFEGDLPGGLAVEEKARRSVAKPHFEVRVTGFRKHLASPVGTIGSRALIEIDVEIETAYYLPSAALGDDARDAVLAAADQDADVLRQALEFSGNLTQTAAAVATGLVSGRLEHLEYELGDESMLEEERYRLSTHRFRGVVDVTQAVA